MQQTFQCFKCGAHNYFGQQFCWQCRQQLQYNCPNCGNTINFGARLCGNCGIQMNLARPIDEQEGPSMHIIPLDPHTRTPVIFSAQGQLQLPAITINGRLSWLTATTGSEQAILARIEERYPKEHYHDVHTYLCCGVNIKHLDNNTAAFIFEVWGFWEPMKELEQLYYMINSLSDRTVGDAHWNQIVQYLDSDPVRTWINSLIDFLKKQLNWKDYVAQALEIY